MHAHMYTHVYTTCTNTNTFTRTLTLTLTFELTSTRTVTYILTSTLAGCAVGLRGVGVGGGEDGESGGEEVPIAHDRLPLLQGVRRARVWCECVVSLTSRPTCRCALTHALWHPLLIHASSLICAVRTEALAYIHIILS